MTKYYIIDVLPHKSLACFKQNDEGYKFYSNETSYYHTPAKSWVVCIIGFHPSIQKTIQFVRMLPKLHKLKFNILAQLR